MEGSRSSREFHVKREFESNRLEEEVWRLAYEQLWPQVRHRPEATVDETSRSANDSCSQLTKGA